MKSSRKKILKFTFLCCLVAFSLTNLTPLNEPWVAKDLLSGFFKNTVATFEDAAELLYNSLNTTRLAENKKKQAEFKKRIAVSKHQEEKALKSLHKYLKENKINSSQPILKEDFAKLLFKRFEKLPVSFLTKTLQFSVLYFKDAQTLHIFKKAEAPTETLTIKEMVNAFLKADQLENKN